MRLSAPVQRCLDQFAESQSWLSANHAAAIGEIRAGLASGLLLDRRLCDKATRCAEATQAASDNLSDAQPGLLFSGQGALVDFAGLLDGDEMSASLVETLRSKRVPSDGGLLWVKHDPFVEGCHAKLLQRPRQHRQQPAENDSRDQQREFVDWLAAMHWLADAQTRSSNEDEVTFEYIGEYGEVVVDDWELRINCPNLDKIQVVIAPRLTSGTRRRLRRFMSSCALFLQRLTAGDATDDTYSEKDATMSEHEREIFEAVEHGLLLHIDEAQTSLSVVQGQLYFIIDASSGPAFFESARCLVEANLREFVLGNEERRSRVLVDGDWQLGDLLTGQLYQLQRESLRRLLGGLTTLTRSVRGVLVSKRTADFSDERQRRPPRKLDGDLQRLQESAESAARSFQRLLDNRLGDLSVQIEFHLRQQEVKDRLAAAYAQHSLRYPQLGKQELQRCLMEQVSAELYAWNRQTRVLTLLDRDIAESRVQHLRKLQRQAQGIPELLVCCASNSFCGPLPVSPQQSESSGSGSAASDVDEGPSNQNPEYGDSLSSQTVISVGIRQLGCQPMRPSLMQNLAVSIGMPLFVPLVVITAAIMGPVSFFRRNRPQVLTPTSKRQSVEKLRDDAWDFLDKLTSRFIYSNFFVNTRRFFKEDAKKLSEFVDRYCILPQNGSPERTQLTMDPTRLLGQLDNLHSRLQGLVASVKIYGAVQLGDGMIPAERCRRLGIDIEVADAALVGERIGGGSFSDVYALRHRQQKDTPTPLALKLIRVAATNSALLEAEVLRELATDLHPNLLPGLGSVYFPRLGRIGLLMPRCQGNLREFLLRHRRRLVPAFADDASAALTTCLKLYQQILAGVRHLHSRHILHRDLKLENVLVDGSETDGSGAQLRICDFGFAKDEEVLSGNSFVGTRGYLAPELATPQPLFSIKSDIYALGVMLWECYFGTSAPSASVEFPIALLEGDQGVNFVIGLMTHRIPMERPHVEQCIAMLKLRQNAAANFGDVQVRLVSYADSLEA